MVDGAVVVDSAVVVSRSVCVDDREPCVSRVYVKRVTPEPPCAVKSRTRETTDDRNNINVAVSVSCVYLPPPSSSCVV